MKNLRNDVNGVSSGDIVTFNVGGVRFETLWSTIEDEELSNLGNNDFLQQFYVDDRGEYFFDRDPDMFKVTLNYLRTGELHLPSYICGPAVKSELEYWGIDQHHIEQCCWITYNEWNSTQEALKRLEHDRKLNTLIHTDTSCGTERTCWRRWRPKVWAFLNRSNYSVGAKVFAYIALFFVVLSIFSFLAETTKYFQRYENIRVYLNTTEESRTHPTATESYQNLRILTEIDGNYRNSTGINETQRNSTENPEHDTNTDGNIDHLQIHTYTEEGIRVEHPVLKVIDVICFSYFVLEYAIRLIFSPNKLKYATTLFAIIDFLALLPDVIEFGIYRANADVEGDVVAFITIIRIFRVLRIFRLVRHSAGLWILVYTLRASFNELILLVWFMGLGILVFSSLIYYVDDREAFTSIPAGFWWALITMTTVGYGDMYPTTVVGKMVGSLCAMAGVLMIGFTIPSLVNNFMLYYRHVQFGRLSDKTEKQSSSKNRKPEVELLKTNKESKMAESQEMKVLCEKTKRPCLKHERKKLVNNYGNN